MLPAAHTSLEAFRHSREREIFFIVASALLVFVVEFVRKKEDSAVIKPTPPFVTKTLASLSINHLNNYPILQRNIIFIVSLFVALILCRKELAWSW